MASSDPYPVRVEAQLDPGLSRWLWLIKWILAIPHLFVLAFLWIGFSLLSIVAFFAILFTGRYPRSIFEFNAGVLRWTWRVAFYAYGALGTDRYPPFTLQDVPDYPARLEIEYPGELSRGLVLVKWWLLAIPHYIIVGVFVGGAAWIAWQFGDWTWSAGGGLLSILVLIAALALAFTGRYPMTLFDLVMGINRWALRVAGYAALMTDRYPPFRLDLGGPEPSGTTGGPPAAPTQPGTAALPVGASRPGWTGGRITALVIGSLLALVSAGLVAGGAAMLWADQTQRDTGDYLSTSSREFATESYALTTEAIQLWLEGPDWMYPGDILGTVRVRVTAESTPIFVGIARSADVAAYLDDVARAEISDATAPSYRAISGTRAPSPPAEQAFWAASAEGTGTQSIRWTAEEGAWTVVVMRADAAPGVSVRADVGATIPALTAIAVGLLVTGGVILILAAALLVASVVRASRAEIEPVPEGQPVSPRS